MRILKWVLVSGFMGSMSVGCASYVSARKAELNVSGYVSVVFNDVRVYRRTIDSAPTIGSGDEEYKIHMDCDAIHDCKSKISGFYKMMEGSKVLSLERCPLPIYGRVYLYSKMSKYGEDDFSEQFDIDMSGRCVMKDGKVFETEDVILGTFLKKPISEW